MPSPDDRLQELRRQRALVQEQLAFLDREIASVSGEAASKPATPSLPAALAADSDEMLALIKSHQDEARLSPTKAYWGCFWITVATVVLFAICFFALYLFLKGHQPPPVR